MQLLRSTDLTVKYAVQQTIYEAVKDMVEKGYEPPVFKSANIDGGREYNQTLEEKYGNRIWHK